MSILDANGNAVNGNGVASLTERQMKKQLAMNATIGDVNEIAHAHATKAMNHLGNQIPGFVQSMVAAAIQGYHASLVQRGIVPPDVEPVTPQPPESAVSVEKHEEVLGRDDTLPVTSDGGQ